MINLINRFYDVDEGNIYIDGINVRDLALGDFRRQVGVVLQESFLFAGTIWENIAYANADATAEDVIAAAKIANAHDFIVKFPDGYDTRVGERGQRLSGGERQRIAIARSILHNPRILILDEATSSVDSETEEQIHQAIYRLAENKTASSRHRLSALRNADRLAVLSRGAGGWVPMRAMALKGYYYSLLSTAGVMRWILLYNLTKTGQTTRFSILDHYRS